MTEINKYNNSKIYKICSNLSDKIYIGSTTQSLAQRLSEHIKHYKYYKDDNTKRYITSFEILKLDDYFITLIEEHSYNNRSQLFRREGELIKFNINICVNKVIAGRTRYEYADDNKEHLQEINKIYYSNNKDNILQYQKEYYIENEKQIEERLKQYRIMNATVLNDKRKMYYKDNKSIINEKQKQLVYCECGNSFTVSNKSQHNKTKKHISFITNQYYINELTYYNL